MPLFIKLYINYSTPENIIKHKNSTFLPYVAPKHHLLPHATSLYIMIMHVNYTYMSHALNPYSDPTNPLPHPPLVTYTLPYI